MPNYPPPVACPGLPVAETLPEGSLLWRVHPADRAATSMNPTPRPTALRGGRFDSLDGSYAYLYAGRDERAALAETICRDLPLDGRPRLLPRAGLTARVLSQLRVTGSILLVRMHGSALAQLGQDTWVTKSDARDYVSTRLWAAAVRSWAPQCAGFGYRCRHDEDRQACVLFTAPEVTDHPKLEETGLHLPLDEPMGLALSRQVLAEHNAALTRA